MEGGGPVEAIFFGGGGVGVAETGEAAATGLSGGGGVEATGMGGGVIGEAVATGVAGIVRARVARGVSPPVFDSLVVSSLGSATYAFKILDHFHNIPNIRKK